MFARIRKNRRRSAQRSRRRRQRFLPSLETLESRQLLCGDVAAGHDSDSSNRGTAPKQFACVQDGSDDAVYMPLHGFTAVDLRFQQGDAVSNVLNKMDEPAATATFLNLFYPVWNDPEQPQDVMDRL